jgi:hypothetical protein
MNNTSSYIRSFVEFADSAIQNHASYKNLLEFSTSINKKGNDLISRALMDNKVDVLKLKQEMFKVEKEYVQVFTNILNNNW